MKRKYLPAIMTLAAGFIDCLATIGKGLTTLEFVRQLLIVMVIFFILGCVIRVITDKGMKMLEDKGDKEKNKATEEENSENEQEDIHSNEE